MQRITTTHDQRAEKRKQPRITHTNTSQSCACRFRSKNATHKAPLTPQPLMPPNPPEDPFSLRPCKNLAHNTHVAQISSYPCPTQPLGVAVRRPLHWLNSRWGTPCLPKEALQIRYNWNNTCERTHLSLLLKPTFV